MTEPITINMIRCSYCGDEWLRENEELVCSNCEPILTIDIAVANLLSSVNELALAKSNNLNKRLDLLLSVHHKFTELLKKANPKKEKEDEKMET